MKQILDNRSIWRKRTGLKYLNNFKAFVEYSNDIDNIYKNIEEHNPNEKGKTLIFTFWSKKSDRWN